MKKILILLLVLISTPFIAALFIQNDYHVEQKIVINRSLDDVFAYVVLLKNQNNYSKWALMDPDMAKTYRGTDGTVGFVSAWDSENPDVGKGEQEILAIVPGKRIDYELRFLAPFEATEPAYMTTAAISDNATEVRWGFRGHLNYPMNLMFLFVDFETMIAADLQQGLDGLKVILEK